VHIAPSEPGIAVFEPDSSRLLKKAARIGGRPGDYFLGLADDASEPFGRPVLRLGTPPSAARNALSSIVFSAAIPARNNSLFFAGRVSFVARTFRPSRTEYSDLGIVKLSRTSLAFGLVGVEAGVAADGGVAGGADLAVALGADPAMVGRLGALALRDVEALTVVAFARALPMFFVFVMESSFTRYTVYTVYTDLDPVEASREAGHGVHRR